MKFVRLLLLLCCVTFLFSCRPTRCLKEGEYMLTKNVVKVTDRKGDEFSDLQYLVRPLPNKKFIDVFPIKTSLYANHQPKRDPQTDTIVKDSKFNRWMRSRGEAPVLVDTDKIAYSINQLKIAMSKMGYFDANVQAEIHYEKRKKAHVVYQITAGAPYFVDTLTCHIEIPEYRRIICADTATSDLQVGMQFNANVLLAEKENIINKVRNEGYYYVPNELVYFVVDTMQPKPPLAKKRVGVEIFVNLSRVTNEATLKKYNYKYEFNNVYIHSNYNSAVSETEPMDTVRFSRSRLDRTRYYFITPQSSGKMKKNGLWEAHRDYRYRTLSDLIYTKKGDHYTQNAADRSYKRLSDLKNFNYLNLEFQEVDNARDSVQKIGYLNSVYKLSRSKVHAIAVEADVRSDKANLSFTYSNRNIFKGAETFNVNVYGGMDILFRRTEGKLIVYTENSEAGGELSLDFPRLFIFRKTQKIESLRYSTNIKLGAHWQRSNLYQRLILNTGLTYNWTPNLKCSHSISPIDISIVKIDKYEGFDDVIAKYSLAFQEKYKENVLVALHYEFNYTHPTKNKKNSFGFRLKCESSGMLVTGINALFKMPKAQDGAWKFFGMNYANYELVDFDMRFSHTFNAKNKIATRVTCGVGLPLFNSSVLPFEKSFYLGGANSMRAWSFRTLGPGSYYTDGSRTERSGDIKLEMNVEYRGTIYKFIKFGVFVDAGNIWLMKKDANMPNAEFRFNRFYKEIALAAGAGIRLDFNFFILRVDLALPIYDPNELPDARWINKSDFSKLYIPFAIGYAF